MVSFVVLEAFGETDKALQLVLSVRSFQIDSDSPLATHHNDDDWTLLFVKYLLNGSLQVFSYYAAETFVVNGAEQLLARMSIRVLLFLRFVLHLAQQDFEEFLDICSFSEAQGRTMHHNGVEELSQISCEPRVEKCHRPGDGS